MHRWDWRLWRRDKAIKEEKQSEKNRLFFVEKRMDGKRDEERNEIRTI